MTLYSRGKSINDLGNFLLSSSPINRSLPPFPLDGHDGSMIFVHPLFSAGVLEYEVSDKNFQKGIPRNGAESGNSVPPCFHSFRGSSSDLPFLRDPEETPLWQRTGS